MIVLARHGQTASNRDGRLQGHVDPPLTEHGRAQARRLAGAVGAAAVVRTSPLLRARETAAAIAAGIGATVEIDERLIEVAYGEWEGLSLTEVPAEAWDQLKADPDFRVPGGESLTEVATRVSDFMREFAGADLNVVAVSHVAPIKAAVTVALGVSPELGYRMRLDVAAVTRVGFRDGESYLSTFNETHHLVDLEL
ncbi:MAG: fructose-2,6-bisphosphatase [Actinomycetia bacterium]|nr:fructose-2,6-bisphosphatase [Actinomycetes bacterium]